MGAYLAADFSAEARIFIDSDSCDIDITNVICHLVLVTLCLVFLVGAYLAADFSAEANIIDSDFCNTDITNVICHLVLVRLCLVFWWGLTWQQTSQQKQRRDRWWWPGYCQTPTGQSDKCENIISIFLNGIEFENVSTCCFEGI